MLFSGMKFILATHTYNTRTDEMLDFSSREISLMWFPLSSLKQLSEIH